MTEYDKDSKEESDKGAKTSRVKSGKGLDPVGREDADVNNNGVKNDKSDKYLLKRRAAVGSAIQNRKTVSASYEPEGELIGEEKKKSKKKLKTKSDTITGEGVNNSRHINVKPTMEQTETNAELKKSSDIEDQQKIKLRQKQVQAALNRQRQTMQLQKTGRLPLNYSDDYTPEGKVVSEEESDRRNDTAMERGGSNPRQSYKPNNTPTKKRTPEEIKQRENEVMNRVRQSIIARHGKGALM